MLYKLRKKRIQEGFNLKKMAEKLNISIPYYSQLENEKRKISYKMAVKIANILKVKPDDLFYEEITKRI